MRHLIILMCACATLLLSACGERASVVTITVENPLSIDRQGEMVEVDFAAIREKLSLQNNEVIVLNANGVEVAHQLLSDGKTLIFPTTVAANGRATYRIKAGVPQEVTPRTTGRFVPERMDDFAWENDRVAFRMFGPALLPENPSNGVDVWLKRTEELVQDRWYRDDLAGVASYHIDHGEGLDCFRVGHSLGGGGIVPFVDDVLWMSGPFTRHEVIENGPLRTKFRLFYELSVGCPDGRCSPETPHRRIRATKTISLDAGSQLNRAIVVYEGEGVDGMNVAPGLVLQHFENTNNRDVPGTPRNLLKANNMMAVALNAVSNANTYEGRAFMGIIVPTDVEIMLHEGVCFDADNHLIAVGTHHVGEPFVYYFGSGWDKWGFENDEAWFGFMRNAQRKVENPLNVVSITAKR